MGKGNVPPAEDVDNWTFIDENNDSIFFGYTGCESFMVSYKNLSYDPQDEIFCDIKEHTMKLIKCPNNHIYNADHYPVCPECANEIKDGDESLPGMDQHDIDTSSVEQPAEALNLMKDSPPVGWLVCINGAEYGKAFTLHFGVNTVGRGANMDIHLANDPEISRFIHAKICYEPQKNLYTIAVGDDVNPVIINSRPVAGNETLVLNDRDTIQIGNMTFIFVALCGMDFTWKE